MLYAIRSALAACRPFQLLRLFGGVTIFRYAKLEAHHLGGLPAFVHFLHAVPRRVGDDRQSAHQPANHGRRFRPSLHLQRDEFALPNVGDGVQLALLRRSEHQQGRDPLLLRVSGGGTTFTVTGIGTSRPSTGTGLQSYPFGLIAGSDVATAGETTFGFTNRTYTASGGVPVGGTSNTGAIAFDRPSSTIPNDPWLVTAEAVTPGVVNLQIGTLFGPGGITIYNPQDPTGVNRVYSAQMTIPEPGSTSLVVAVSTALLARRRRRKLSL